MTWLVLLIAVLLVVCAVRILLVGRSFRRSERRYRAGMYPAQHHG